MGKKIPYDQALKMAKVEKNISIFAKDNPYGYKFNVNEPRILRLYEKYKERIGVRILSDKQRMNFERLVEKMINKNKEGSEMMKPCFYCKGRKTKLIDNGIALIVKCEKCGIEVRTPHLTVDSARGYWNTKMASLERKAKSTVTAAAK